MSYELEARQAIADLSDPAANSRLLYESLATLSKSELHKETLFRELKKVPLPTLVKISERIAFLEEDFPNNPVSYGYAGGFRTLINTLLAVNFHLAIEGYESLNNFSPEKIELINRVTSFAFPALISLGLVADGMVYSREKNMDQEYRRAKAGILELIQSLGSKSPAELNKLMSEVEKGKHPLFRLLPGTPEEQVLELVKALSPSELAGLKDRIENNVSFRISLDPSWVEMEEKLVQKLKEIFAKAPQLTAADLLRESQFQEQKLNMALGQAHSIGPGPKRSLFILSVTAFLMGAYGTVGMDPRMTDYVVPLLNINLDEVFRSFWEGPMHRVVAGGVAGSLIWQAFEHRKQRARENKAASDFVPRHSWNLIRSAIVRAESEREKPVAALDESAIVSPRKTIEEIVADPLLRRRNPPIQIHHPSRLGQLVKHCRVAWEKLLKCAECQ